MDKAENDGATPLFVAAHRGHLEVARLLLHAKANMEKAKNDGDTPLSIAAHRGHLEVARLLLDAKADKDKANYLGTTPLSIAAHRGHLEVARLLLHAKANMDKAKKRWRHPSVHRSSLGGGATPLLVTACTDSCTAVCTSSWMLKKVKGSLNPNRLQMLVEPSYGLGFRVWGRARLRG